MKVKLVFHDWQNQQHQSIYSTVEGSVLSDGNFHSGTTFDAEVEFDVDSETDLSIAIDAGYVPVFRVILP